MKPSSSLVKRALVILPIAAAVSAVFAPTFRWMAERFDAADSFYSHGWLIPFAVLWLVWNKRRELSAEKFEPGYEGLGLLIPMLAVHTAATWLQIGFISGFALVGAVWGLVWVFWGWKALWMLRYPMLFLLFMVPLPGILLIATSFKMKLMAASLATWILNNLMGLHTVQAGSTMHIAGINLVVDDTCSGLRSLISMIALSCFWTALLPPAAKMWQKAVLIAGSVPIALATNMVRILILCLLAAIYGPEIAESFIHFGSGIVVFGLAIFLLWRLSRFLVREPAVGARP